MKGGTVVAAGVALVIGVVAAPKLPALLPDAIGGPLARWLSGDADIDVIGTVATSMRSMNQLSIFEARLFSVARTADNGWFKPLDTTTYVIVPGAVRYVINLAAVERRNLNWDPQTATLVAVLPDPVPGEINVDGARARVIVDGIDLASGDKREAILKQSLRVAGDDMKRQARQAFFLQAARTAARTALTQNLAAPLVATGLKPRVVVRFQGEAAIKG